MSICFFQSIKPSPIDERGILSYINIANDGGEFYTPDVLIKKFLDCINTDVEKVLVAECEKYSATLLDLIEPNPKIEFTLTTRQAIKAELLAFACGQFKNVK